MTVNVDAAKHNPFFIGKMSLPTTASSTCSAEFLNAQIDADTIAFVSPGELWTDDNGPKVVVKTICTTGMLTVHYRNTGFDAPGAGGPKTRGSEFFNIILWKPTS